MEQVTATRDTPRWVQAWEADRARGLKSYVLSVGVGYFGLFLFIALAGTHYLRGRLAELLLYDIALSLAAGIALAIASWYWRGAWYAQHRACDSPTSPTR